ncbi:probable Cytochrome c oxidase-assembly factor COX23, mitochondrial [Zygosaccharomyces bailii ISA1307]|nr:probable Cytochrome c oxidase-assembly factor COX23, mitochondrial [Zygosaccharomyces bailii ISA1307]
MSNKKDEQSLREGNPDPQLVVDPKKVDYAPKNGTPDKFQYYPDNPESGLNRYRFAMKEASQYFDPCQESSRMSMNCLDRNNYDRDMCKEYFDAYRECKKQWLHARRQNRSRWE